jgi:hypothetical protein
MSYRRARLWIVAAVCVAGVGATTTAKADPPTAQLRYARGELSECPDEQALRDSIAARLGYDPFRPDGRVVVRVEISRARDVVRADVVLLDAPTGKVTGRKTITSSRRDCSELASAVELAVSIAIDPMHLSQSAPTHPTPSIGPTAPPATASAPIADTAETSPHSAPPDVASAIRRAPPVDAVAVASPPRERWRWRIGGGGVVGIRVVPSASVAPDVFVGARRGAGSVDVEGRFYAPTSSDAAARGNVQANLLLAILAPCLHLGIGMACALGAVGALHGQGGGVDVPLAASTFYSAVGARAGIEVPLSDALLVYGSGDFLAPLVSTTLSLRGTGVWSTGFGNASIGLGLAGRL